MAFDYLEAGTESCVIERVGELAQTPADTRYKTTFTEFASCNISFPSAWASDLRPKTESGVGGDLQAIDLKLQPYHTNLDGNILINWPAVWEAKALSFQVYGLIDNDSIVYAYDLDGDGHFERVRFDREASSCKISSRRIIRFSCSRVSIHT